MGTPRGLKHRCRPYSVVEGLAGWLARTWGQTLVYLKAAKRFDIFKVCVIVVLVLVLVVTLRLIFTFENSVKVLVPGRKDKNLPPTLYGLVWD